MKLIVDNSFAVLESLVHAVPDAKHTARLMVKVVFERSYLRSAGLIRQKHNFYGNVFGVNI